MIQFARLRLQGFKSFVERTELDIGPGLTGIVGPNGCGKSNLVEALKWIMGESSAKKMRGGTGSMDDVIFNGTERRPARNMAEVSLLLDNTARTAPAPWNIGDDVEIVRKIEREHGSSYRINGKGVRARDVAILMADVSSGSGSPYLVSQGRVTAMINAKPAERRMILEEAAGITGLYARRHEAELRLRATDANLMRLQDIVGSMESRLNGLKKQARQAARYRELSAAIRQLDSAIATMEWRIAWDSLRAVEREFDAVEAQVAARMVAANQLTGGLAAQSGGLPALRQADAERGAALQAHRLGLQRLEDEGTRTEAQLSDIAGQLAKLAADHGHEAQSLTDATAALERINVEDGTLSSQGDGDDILAEKENARLALQKNVAALEAEQTELTQDLATVRAQRAGLEQKVEQDAGRRDAIQRRLDEVRTALAAKRANRDKDDPAAALRARIDRLDPEAADLRAAIAALETTIAARRNTVDASRAACNEAERRQAKLDSDIAALRSVLDGGGQKAYRPVLDDMRAAKGFEIALSRALGDGLAGSLDAKAPVTWRGAPIAPGDLAALPDGAEALEPHVKAPAQLRLALSQIGYVARDDDGETLARQLRPGQALVSASGAYWRWDGLHVRAAAIDRNAVQLQQRNRLADLEKQVSALAAEVATGQAAFAAADRDLQAVGAELGRSRGEAQNIEQTLRDHRIALTRAVEAQSARHAELAKLEEALSIAETDLGELTGQLEGNRVALAAFDDAGLAANQARLDAVRQDAGRERDRLHDAIRAFEAHRQENSRRKARQQAIGDERVNLNNRCIRGRERLKDLAAREADLQARQAAIAARPREIRAAHEDLLGQVHEMQRLRGEAGDRLAALETTVADTAKALKAAEAALGEAREARAHAQATAAERQRQLEALRADIGERFDMTPEALSQQAALDPDNLPRLDAPSGRAASRRRGNATRSGRSTCRPMSKRRRWLRNWARSWPNATT